MGCGQSSPRTAAEEEIGKQGQEAVSADALEHKTGAAEVQSLEEEAEAAQTIPAGAVDDATAALEDKAGAAEVPILEEEEEAAQTIPAGAVDDATAALGRSEGSVAAVDIEPDTQGEAATEDAMASPLKVSEPSPLKVSEPVGVGESLGAWAGASATQGYEPETKVGPEPAKVDESIAALDTGQDLNSDGTIGLAHPASPSATLLKEGGVVAASNGGPCWGRIPCLAAEERVASAVKRQNSWERQPRVPVELEVRPTATLAKPLTPPVKKAPAKRTTVPAKAPTKSWLKSLLPRCIAQPSAAPGEAQTARTHATPSSEHRPPLKIRSVSHPPDAPLHS